jgi:uncharacterized membrane protein YeiH
VSGPTVIPLWLDLAAVGVGAFQGALYAIVRHGFDLVGITVLAGVTGMGGGILRDLLLGVRPALLQDRYLIIVVIATLTAVIFARWHERGRRPVLIADAITVGLYAVAGTYKALELDASVLVAILLGVITAVGGGVFRDLLSGATPAIFRGGPLYATAALLGSVVFVVLRQFNVSLTAAVIVGALATVALRIASLRFRWSLPPITR